MKWRVIPGWDKYEVSDCGDVRSLPRKVTTRLGTFNRKGRNLNPFESSQGYRFVNLSQDGMRKRTPVHRLVLIAFRGAPKKYHETRHLNGLRSDNTIGNLAWGTCSENRIDKERHGTGIGGESNNGNVLPKSVILTLRSHRKYFERVLKKYGVGRMYLFAVARGTGWTEARYT